jgi:universal stress protein E
MHVFRNILVIRGARYRDDWALARAHQVADAHGASITFADLDSDDVRAAVGLPIGTTGLTEKAVGQMATGLSGAGRVPAGAQATVAEVTTPKMDRLACEAALHDRIARVGHDLVICGADEVDDLAETPAALLPLISGCPCPFWLVRPAGQGSGRAIIAAVDPAPQDQGRDALCNLVIRTAIALAGTQDARLTILNAWAMGEDEALRHSLAHVPALDLDEMLAAEERQSLWRLRRLLRDFGGAADRMEIIHQKGDAAEVICDRAAAGDVDTIVIGMSGRAGQAEPLVGTTAETVLRRARCSVLTVRSDAAPAPDMAAA